MGEAKRRTKPTTTYEEQAQELIKAFNQRTGRTIGTFDKAKSRADLEILKDLLRSMEETGPPPPGPGFTIHDIRRRH
jgi:hypothetical protein